MEEVSEIKPEYEFDFDTMPINSNIAEMHQEGNQVIGITEAGVRFMKIIPNDKMLSKNEKGEWCFIPLRGNLG